MEKIIFGLSKRTKRAYITAFVFIVVFCAFLIFSLIYNRSIIAYKILDLVFLLVVIYNGVFFLLSPARTHLKVTDSIIEFVTPYGTRKIQCNDAVQLENTPAKLTLIYKKGLIKPNPWLDFLVKRDRIPLSLFVEDWVDDKVWKKDALLVWIDAHYQITKSK